jgi:hypothetical protein
VLAAPKMQMNMPHVSPDGRTVAFIGGLMSDFGSVGGDVYTVPIAGGEPVDVTPNFAGTFNGIAWRGKRFAGLGLAGRRCRRWWRSTRRAQHAHAVERAGDGLRLARRPLRVQRRRQGGGLGARGLEHAPRIVAGRLPAAAPITRDNEASRRRWPARSVTWTNEGFKCRAGWSARAGRRRARNIR